MRTVLVAAPLVTKGGVFHTVCELVESARDQGLEWSGVIVTRGKMGIGKLPPGVQLHDLSRSGAKGLMDLRNLLRGNAAIREADAVISLIPQTDMVLASLGRRSKLNISFVRGAAWPRKGEANLVKRYIWRFAERFALASMSAVWVTTPVLKSEIEWPMASIVPAGIALEAAKAKKVTLPPALVWAARMSVDKNPELFLEMVRQLDIKATMYGEGELGAEISANAPQGLSLPGWIDDPLWSSNEIYVGTSYREAFGRSAVEAAAAGLPIILSESFGAAPLLFTDAQLRDQFVLDPHNTRAWIAAAKELLEDWELREKVARHVQTNAQSLSIDSSVRAIAASLADLRTSPPRP